MQFNAGNKGGMELTQQPTYLDFTVKLVTFYVIYLIYFYVVTLNIPPDILLSLFTSCPSFYPTRSNRWTFRHILKSTVLCYHGFRVNQPYPFLRVILHVFIRKVSIKNSPIATLFFSSW